MKKNHQVFNILGITLFAAAVFVLHPGCVPVFSDLQSARMAGPGNIELTPSYSSVSYQEEGESERIQNHYGIQAAVGITRQLDFRVRYERVQLDEDSFRAMGVNVLGFGPKFSLYQDYAAVFVPVGFAFGEDIVTSESWQIHPTLLLTLPVNRYIELNASGKILIPFDSDQDTLYAVNFSPALSLDLRKWAIRPEIGFLFHPDGEGHYMHLSLGFTFGFK